MKTASKNWAKRSSHAAPNAVVLTVLAAFLLSPASSSAQLPRFEAAFNEGVARMRAGNLEEAAAAFTQATALNPASAEAQMNLGLVLLQQNKWPESETALAKSIALKPRLRGPGLFLGIDYYHEGQFSKAQPALQHELAIDSKNPTVLMWLGIVQLEEGNAAAAIVSLDAAVALKPDDVDILYHRGRAHMLVSKQSYDHMYKIDPSSWRVHQVLATSFAEADRTDDAVAECKLAIQMRPAEPGLHQQLGDIYWTNNQLDKAETEFQDELRIDPQSYEAMYKLGVVSLEKAKPELAAQLLTEALRRAPTSLETHYQLGRAEAQLGQLDAAIKDFSQVVAEPNDAAPETVRQSYYQMSRIYQRQHNPEQAKIALDSFLRLKQQADSKQQQNLESKVKRQHQIADESDPATTN